MGAVLEGRDNPEVAAAAAYSPEQLGVGVLAGRDDLAGGEYHFGGQQVVDSHPVAAHEPGEAAAEREAGDPGARDDAAGRREAERGGCAIELADEDPGLRANGLPDGVDVDPLHRRQVDHQAAVGDRLARDVVTAAADRDLGALVAAEVDGVDHVRRGQAAGDQGGALVDQPVVDVARLVVTG